jgi:hypothetical protein
MVLQLSSFLLFHILIVDLVMQNPDNPYINCLPVDMV